MRQEKHDCRSFFQVSGLKAIGNIKDFANLTKLSAEFDVCKMAKINT